MQLKNVFALFAADRLKSFGRAQAPLIDMRSEAESIGFAMKGLLLAPASTPTAEFGRSFGQVARLLYLCILLPKALKERFQSEPMQSAQFEELRRLL